MSQEFNMDTCIMTSKTFQLNDAIKEVNMSDEITTNKKSASISRIADYDSKSKIKTSNIKVVVRFRPNTHWEEELLEQNVGFNICKKYEKNSITLKEK